MAGELAGDGDGDDRAAFAVVFECVPALMEAARALVGTSAYGGRLALTASFERSARA